MSQSDRLYAFKNGWRWAIQGGGIVAAIRVLFDAYVRGHNGETCYQCGRQYVMWRADNGLWEQLAEHGLYCPNCFEKLAIKAGVQVTWHALPTRSVTSTRLYDETATEIDPRWKPDNWKAGQARP